jgi:hypothetical protein
MPASLDLTGRRVGQLTVHGLAPADDFEDE